MFAWFAPPEIRVRCIVGIGPHDQQIARLTLITMRDAGWHHHDIASPNLQYGPTRPTEQNRGLTAGDAKDLMRRTVEVVERMHAIAPRRRPSIGPEHLFDR